MTAQEVKLKLVRRILERHQAEKCLADMDINRLADVGFTFKKVTLGESTPYVSTSWSKEIECWDNGEVFYPTYIKNCKGVFAKKPPYDNSFDYRRKGIAESKYTFYDYSEEEKKRIVDKLVDFLKSKEDSIILEYESFEN